MIGFYVLRGHSHDDLMQLSNLEKQIYMHWMNQFYEDEAKKYNALMGGK